MPRSKEYVGIFSDFWVQENEGFFGAYVSELNIREENEYFSFIKNIPWVIFGIFREGNDDIEGDGSLG